MDTNKEKRPIEDIAEDLEEKNVQDETLQEEQQSQEETPQEEQLSQEEQMSQEEQLSHEEQHIQEEPSESDVRIHEITLRLHEIDLLLDEYEERLFEEHTSIEVDQEYDHIVLLKKEYKQLKNELKATQRTSENKFWDKVPIWMFMYGIIQIVMSSFLIMPWLTVYAFDAFAISLTGMLETNIGAFFLIFGLTFINLLITGVIFYIVFKDKLKRIVISVVWGLQLLSSVTTFLTLWNTYINFINWS